MVNMPNVLGMRLEDALAECRAQGVEPEIVMTLPPKGREQGTIRVIRAKEGVLTVSRFEDELSPVVQGNQGDARPSRRKSAHFLILRRKSWQTACRNGSGNFRGIMRIIITAK